MTLAHLGVLSLGPVAAQPAHNNGRVDGQSERVTGDLYDSWFTHVDPHGAVRALGEFAAEDRGVGMPTSHESPAHFIASVVPQELSRAMQRVGEVSRERVLPLTMGGIP